MVLAPSWTPGFAPDKADYNGQMDTNPNRVRVTASRPGEHAVTVHLRPGDVVGVGHRNQQFPEFVWCAAEDGNHGWVAESYLEMTGEKEAVAVREYSGKQLTVIEDEVLDVIERQGVWTLCRNSAGSQGWVPTAILEDAVAPAPARREQSLSPDARSVRILTSCTSEQVQEIRFREGDSLTVGHRNQQHPAFVWCATADGHQGWVPEDYIEAGAAHDAVARRAYDSTHLTTGAGETLDVLEHVGGYLLCRTAAGVEGWVQETCVEEIVAER
jgi:hypothetical protein